jgi:hypothetical protein
MFSVDRCEAAPTQQYVHRCIGLFRPSEAGAYFQLGRLVTERLTAAAVNLLTWHAANGNIGCLTVMVVGSGESFRHL